MVTLDANKVRPYWRVAVETAGDSRHAGFGALVAVFGCNTNPAHHSRAAILGSVIGWKGTAERGPHQIARLTRMAKLSKIALVWRVL